jgi:hypothetical protein
MKDVSNKDAMSCVAYLSRFSREMTKIVVRNTGSDCPVEFGEVKYMIILITVVNTHS